MESPLHIDQCMFCLPVFPPFLNTTPRIDHTNTHHLNSIHLDNFSHLIYTISSQVRKAARELLKLEEKNPKRLFEGAALLRRLHRLGVLDESKNKLDFVLGLKHEDFLERRLQTLVFKLHLAKSIHHARVLVRQGHIRYVPCSLFDVCVGGGVIVRHLLTLSFLFYYLISFSSMFVY